ncbi:MAG: hypothetical protein K9G62_07695 [Alphaproteobacteria bacterium]|nr:hypothetical protein [Alphaproteobacteria bacterium]
MPVQTFTTVASLPEPPPREVFARVLGRMLLGFEEITKEQFDLVGEAQARTVVIAEAYANYPDRRPAILQKFPKRGVEGEFDLNEVAFKYTPETIVPELDSFIRDLSIPEVKERMNVAKAAVDAEKGVRPDAAASALLLKKLLLKKDEEQAVVNASLIMQHAVRSFDRLEVFARGEYDRQAALDLSNTSNKLNYKFDPPALQDANEGLLTVCTIERDIAKDLLRKPETDEETLRTLYEPLAQKAKKEILEAVPTAIQLYRSAGRDGLADKAEAVYQDLLKALPGAHLIMKKNSPAPEPNIPGL